MSPVPPVKTRARACAIARLLVFSTALLGFSTRAEELSHWDVPTLTRHSDLVITGTLEDHGFVTVGRVLKGNTESKQLSLPSIEEYENSSEFSPSQVTLGREVLLFLDQRSHPTRLVANGFFLSGTLGSETGVFGYQQMINPGPYVLSPFQKFPNFAPLEAQVEKECLNIPAVQLAALDALKASIPSNSFQTELGSLCRITRRGDRAILRQISTLDVAFPGMDAAFLAGFIGEVQDPGALDLLIAMDKRSTNYGIRPAIASLGTREAFDYLLSLLNSGKEREPVQVLYLLKPLYLACEQREDAATCSLIRDEIFRQMDKDLMNLTMLCPQLLSIIPDEGSIGRLQRAYDYHRKFDNNVGYHLELLLAECRKKIEAAKAARLPAGG